MSDTQIEYLSALLFARPELSAQMNAQMHIATDRKVRITTFLPMFDISKAIEILKQMRPQVVIIDAHVDGFTLSEVVNLRQQAAEPFIVVGLAQAGSTEMEQLLGYDLDANYALPLNPQLYNRFDADLPPKYVEVSRSWGKGVWSAGAPEAIKAATAAAGATSWQRSAIAVYSPKGGVGKTVIACELAATLAALGGRDVALIDANMNGGHVKLRLNVDVPHGILNAAATWHTNKGHPSLESDALQKVLGYLVPLAGTSNLKVLPVCLFLQHDRLQIAL
ncbi:MAG: P-loop NTPase, partial [Anaerolineales bacterium]